MKIKEVNQMTARKKSLTEALANSRAILAESVSGLTEEQSYVVNRIYKEFTPLIEAILSQDQVNQIFQGVEQSASASGSNRTLIGKGVDYAKEANKIIDQFGVWLQDTKPVVAFDQKFEQLKRDIKGKLGDNSKVMMGINTLAKAAAENPGTTAAVIGLLTVIASIAGSPAAGTLVAFTLRASVDLVKGEKLSTAIGRGLKTAAITWLTGKAFELVKDAVIAVADQIADLIGITTNITPINDVVGNVKMDVTVNSTQYINVTDMPMLKTDYIQLDGLKKAFYDACPPGGNGADAAMALQTFNAKLAELSTQQYADIVQKALGDSTEVAFTTYDTVRDGMNQVGDAVVALAQGVAAGASAMPGKDDKSAAEEPKGTTLDTDTDKVQSGPGNRQVNDIVQFGAAGEPSNARWTGEEGKEWEIVGGALFDRLIDDPSQDRMNNIQRDTSSKMNKLFIDKDNAKKLFTLEGKRLMRGQQRAVFEAVQYIYEDPGVLTRVQQGVTKVLNKLAVKGGNLTNKVTADKLQQAWVKAGSPMDSDDIADFLQQQGVEKSVVTTTYDTLKITPAAPTITPAGTKTEPEPEAKVDGPAGGTIDTTKTTDTTDTTADAPAVAATASTAPATPTQNPSVFADVELMTSVYANIKKSGQDLPDAVKQQIAQIIQQAETKTESRRILNSKINMLTEAKARIDHPEDLVFEEGSSGAIRALEAIIHAAHNPSVNTVKWDGTPAIIFGRDDQGFIMTDKSGFGAKKYDGMARSSKMFRDMIFDRKPDQPGRLEYSTQLARLYPMLEKIVPVKFRGFIQGDIMWMNTPQVHDGVIDIQPLKVKYTIDASSDLGKKISKSHAGIVVHSYFSDKSEEEPRALTPAEIQSLKSSPGMIVLSPVMQINTGSFVLPADEIEKVRKFITAKGPAIDKLLDNMSISSLKISNLPDIFKSFLNAKAYRGENGLTQKEFIDWLQSPDSKLTASKLQNVSEHLAKNKAGFDAVFKLANAIVNLKYMLKSQLDDHASENNSVVASVRDEPGHEGFVADTPHGKIKLVNRPVFMKKV
jgi:hypothetical protein